MSSTNLISGLASGFDWRSVIDELMTIEYRRVDLLTDQKQEYEDHLSEWQSVNTMLLSLKTAAGSLATEDAFNLFTSSTTTNTTTTAASLLTVSTSSTASAGTYNIKVNNLAEAEKISSAGYTSTTTALSLSGDILISGQVVQITATDTLANIKDKINALNEGDDPSGVTATIVTHSSTDYRLVLTSDETGDEGIDIREGSSDGVLQAMGFIGSGVETATPTSDGAKSALFTGSSTAVGTLLELTGAPGDTTVQIGGEDVVINLATQSLTSIAQNIDALSGVSASVVSETVDGETRYRIDISGTTSFTDSGNVLQILGIQKGSYESVAEVRAGDAIYAAGGAAATAATTFADIFTGSLRGDAENSLISAQGGGSVSASAQWNWINTGGDANDFDGDESITVTGTDHDGNVVSDTYSLAGKGDETLDVFLAWVEDLYGDSGTVDASFDSSGRLVIEDLQSGSSQMSVTVTPNNTALQFNTAGAFGNDISNGDTITIAGTRGDGTTVSAITYTITDTATDTLQDLLDTIHDGGAGDDAFGETSRTATLSIADGKITITDDTAGDSLLTLTLTANNQGKGTLNFGDVSAVTEGREMQLAAGEDAQITLDGAVITKDSNTITDVIEGATLNLVGASADTTVTLKIERDLASIKSKIQGMASAYNSLMSYINTQFSYDEDTEEVGGVLFGDGTLRSVKSDLISTVTESVTGLSSSYNRLALIGITLDDSVNMTIDDDDLTEALETNFSSVKNLFTAYGSASSALFQYVGHTDETEGGSYAVNITTAATQTTVTGGTSLAGTIGAGVTLTITDFATGRQAADVDVAGMDIDGVVNALNSEFANETTEEIRGDTDTGYTSATLWSAVAGAEDGDIITFSGIKRSGVVVSGSYAVDTTQTVGDLLDGIEAMFDNEVTASLDDSNRLVITDKQVGDSLISFNINTSAVSGLDFGTLSTVTEGRYAMDITASKTVDNKLLLTHNAYGTGHVITTESDGGDPLGLNGTSPTKVWGVDVAGTINGEAATGSGQMLSLSSTSSNNAAGLSMLYTGSGTTSTTFTLTVGIAELLERQLGFITDSSDGYATFKQTSLGDRIDDYTDRIEDMEDLLARKMESMINQFVAMELALSQISSQSDWLSGQINASYSAWY